MDPFFSAIAGISLLTFFKPIIFKNIFIEVIVLIPVLAGREVTTGDHAGMFGLARHVPCCHLMSELNSL
jgi:hypothetical protein